MFIFGWGHVTNKAFGATMAVRCPNCNNETWLELSRHRKWFTWFFIPIGERSFIDFLVSVSNHLKPEIQFTHRRSPPPPWFN